LLCLRKKCSKGSHRKYSNDKQRTSLKNDDYFIMTQKELTHNAIELLKGLISTPSLSSEEDKTAILVEDGFSENNIPFKRENNNILAFNKHYKEGKPLLLLNSHHDTVKPNSAFTKDPFNPLVQDGKLYGLGSNDA